MHWQHLDFVNSDYVRHPGLEVAIEPEKVDGRVLPSLHMEYGKGKSVQSEGAWNMRDLCLFLPKTLKMWSVSSFDPIASREEVARFTTGLIRCMKRLGPYVIKPP